MEDEIQIINYEDIKPQLNVRQRTIVEYEINCVNNKKFDDDTMHKLDIGLKYPIVVLPRGVIVIWQKEAKP